jgi:hypothetical protein
VREQQHGRDVQVAEPVEPLPESHDVHDDDHDRHRDGHGDPEPPVQTDQPRRRDHDEQVEAQEPQRAERHRLSRRHHASQQTGLAPQRRAGGLADIGQVQTNLHDDPGARRRPTAGAGERRGCARTRPSSPRDA